MLTKMNTIDTDDPIKIDTVYDKPKEMIPNYKKWYQDKRIIPNYKKLYQIKMNTTVHWQYKSNED